MEHNYAEWVLNNINNPNPPKGPANLDLISVDLNYERYGQQHFGYLLGAIVSWVLGGAIVLKMFFTSLTNLLMAMEKSRGKAYL